MVLICSEQYDSPGSPVPVDERQKMATHFAGFPFTLSDFQKYALTAIVGGDHVLVTAHTGSGKTLPAEFAIRFFCAQGKKVIYTSPIKALSNQKFYEFSRAFPDLSVGILTGDIKFNPEADVLIMTTEILRNNLINRPRVTEVAEVAEDTDCDINTVQPQPTSNLHFDIDIDTELACVVFDEVHYINDADRGKVWEESIMMLPEHVQMVMLSATIDKADVFARWCEDRYPSSNGGSPNDIIPRSGKQVWLAPTNHRAVPLTHYSYVVTPEGFYKQVKDKAIQKRVREYCGDFHVLRDPAGAFSETTAHQTHSVLRLLEKHRVRVTSEFVLESALRFLAQRDMLPAICFVFSRKNVERFAKNISISLFPPDSKIPETIESECKSILRKLPNYTEYVNLPEFRLIVACLQKGIAIHHSGIIPVFREMIELLFARGFICALFATETFSVGINMPTKTVLFTALSKFTDGGNRWLHSHEYTQMAGRAGRRGMDTVGHVVHLNNMLWGGGGAYPDASVYRGILAGVPQTLTSKFSVNFDIILNTLDSVADSTTITTPTITTGYASLGEYAQKSMLYGELAKRIGGIDRQIADAEVGLAQIATTLSPTDMVALERYTDMTIEMDQVGGNKRKKMFKELNALTASIVDLGTKKRIYAEHVDRSIALDRMRCGREHSANYFDGTMRIKFDYLLAHGFVSLSDDGGADSYTTTVRGKVATMIREAPGLTIADLFEERAFADMTTSDTVGLLSCFANIRVSDDIRTRVPPPASKVGPVLAGAIERLRTLMTGHMASQLAAGIFDSSDDPDRDIQYDIVEDTIAWCACETEGACRELLENIKDEKSLFPGEFVKALLKINNVALELQNACEHVGDVALSHTLSAIPAMTLKFIATNQSLYV
jgi:superfamily II RNA helicase